MSPSERRINFEKNLRLPRRNGNSISPKATCHHCGNKGHVRPILHVRNVKFPNGTMVWIPKCSLTNP